MGPLAIAFIILLTVGVGVTAARLAERRHGSTAGSAALSAVVILPFAALVIGPVLRGPPKRPKAVVRPPCRIVALPARDGTPEGRFVTRPAQCRAHPDRDLHYVRSG